MLLTSGDELSHVDTRTRGRRRLTTTTTWHAVTSTLIFLPLLVTKYAL